MQSLLEKVCDRGLARSREAREPEDARLLSVQRRTCRLVDFKRLPMNIGRATQRVRNHSAADGGKCEAIDENKAPGLPIFLIGVERERAIERDIAKSDLIEIQMLRREVFARTDVYSVLQPRDLRAYEACTCKKKIGSARQQGLIAHPDEVRGKLFGKDRARCIGGDKIATADVDVVIHGQSDRVASAGAIKIAVHSDDAGNMRGLPGWQNSNPVAGPHEAARDRATVAAEVLVRPIDPLDRHPK